MQTCFAKSMRSAAVLDMSGEISNHGSFPITEASLENNNEKFESGTSLLELEAKAQLSFAGFGISIVKFMTGSNSVCKHLFKNGTRGSMR